SRRDAVFSLRCTGSGRLPVVPVPESSANRVRSSPTRRCGSLPSRHESLRPGGIVGSVWARMGEGGEGRYRLEAAVKSSDGFFTTFFVSPYSKFLARWFARRGWTPNAVTLLSMLTGLVAAALFATGQRWGLIAGAVALQLAFTFD